MSMRERETRMEEGGRITGCLFVAVKLRDERWYHIDLQQLHIPRNLLYPQK